MCRQWQLQSIRARPPLPAPLPCRSNLAGNELGGSLPARWARLVRLERLSLEGNRLTGTLPATWNMLEGMQYL